MKRLMCVMLSVAIILSIGISAFAAEDSEMAGIVKLVKNRLEVPEAFVEFESEKHIAGGENVYNLFWKTSGEEYSEIYASVLSSGEIISYNYYDSKRDYDKTGIAACEKEEYLKAAQKWIKRINPSYAAELDMDADVRIDGIHSYNVRVTFDRKKDGIPVYNDYVHIAIDKYTGRVNSMNAQWSHPEKTAYAGGVISAEQGGKILGEMAGLQLRYEKLRDEKYAVLMYSPTRFGMMIDAKSGEEFTVEYVDSEQGDAGGGALSGATNDSAANDKMESMLTGRELESIEEIESLLTKAQLSNKIKNMANTAVSSFNVKSVNYRNVGKSAEEKIYEARVYLTNAEGESANVTFDAVTGELKSLYTYLNYTPKKKQIKKRNDMKRSAKRFIDTWAADVADKACVFESSETPENMGGYFVFTHNENGIEYEGNNIRIRVDESTGKILSFSKLWDKEIVFEATENIITLEEATGKYIEAASATLYYIANKREMYASNKAAELALIYRFSDSSPAFINAKTGECYDWDMGQKQNEPEGYALQADIRGHWAEKAVRTLADNGIVISYDENFSPDEAITQEEIALLVDCFNGGYRPYEVTENDYVSCIDRLVRQSVIKPGERNPDKKVTREECVAYLVRMFGFGSAAELSGIYKTEFSDEAKISTDKVGYVAIAKALGVVSGNGAKFNPKADVTRAELAVMLYNALEK